MRALIAAARALSAVSRPYYLPVTCFAALFLLTYLRLLPLGFKLAVLCVVCGFTVWLPRMGILLYRKVKGWGPVQLRRRENRAVPYAMFMVSYAACLHLMARWHLPRYMCGILVGALLVQAVCVAANMRWKISTHCAGAGGLVGALAAYSLIFGFNPVGWLCVLILLSGAVGTARMLLRQHTLAQVVAGWLVGVAGGMAGILLV